jgi:hypothetical protein
MMKVAGLILAACVMLAAASAQDVRETALFNGVDLSNWGFVLQDTTKIPGEVFRVEDGTILIKGMPFGYMYTKERYGNFRLQLEWQWPEKAANSGIFLFVQDDQRLWPDAIECQLKAGSAGDLVLLGGGSGLAEFVPKAGEERPKFPMIGKRFPSSELPAGEWNRADIRCMDGSISIYINGVLQNEGSGSTHRSGHIALQSEGGEIRFRNIRLTATTE